jgi:NTP pyrophosphatase (non-canonical NTP hydrolase)
MMNDQIVTVEELKTEVRHFTSERGWDPDARSLAISISIEAAELLEHFQWLQRAASSDRSAICMELADILIYCLQFAMFMRLDITTAVRNKLAVNAVRYPAGLFRDNRGASETYFAAKRAARDHVGQAESPPSPADKLGHETASRDR